MKHQNLVLAEFLATTCADQGLFSLSAGSRREQDPLLSAAHQGAWTVVLGLLEGGANVNARGGYYGNALQAASAGGHGEIVKQLLEGGADANAQGGLNGNELYAASGSGHGKILKQLLERGADVDAQSNVRRSV